MTPSARAAARVLLDTSVFINFAEGGSLFQLSAFLGGRAAITLDVSAELRRNAALRFPELKTLDRLGWPKGEPLALPADLLADADALRRLHSAPGSHTEANRGEISTVLMAARLGGTLVIIDDTLGKRLCQLRGLERRSSAQLASEMTASDALDDDVGFRVFDIATPSNVGRAEFDEAVAKARGV